MTLTGVPETLLIALWARAAATQEKDPIIRDEKAVEMVSRIDYDFSRFEKARLTRLGVAVRTLILDQQLATFLEQHPDAVVINLGAGLDTRYQRVCNGAVDWYEIDLPDSIEMRKRFFEETAYYRFISKSLFDLSWMDEVDVAGRPVLFLAEGLFMYFEESQLQQFFKELVQRMPGSEMLFEMLAPFMVGKSSKHESVKKIDSSAEFKWGLKNSKDMETWAPGITYVDEHHYYDHYKERWGIFGKIARLPIIRPYLACRIVHLRFN